MAHRDSGQLLRHLSADLGDLVEQRGVALALGRPRHLVGEGNRRYAHLRGRLLARGELGDVTALLDPHLALDDRDARALGPVADGEDRALDGDLAVGRIDVQAVAPRPASPPRR